MNIVNSPCLSLIAGALVLGGGGVPAVAAQTEIVQPLSADADALSAEMRTLAANPNDFNALVRAGELALNLGDTAAAARFFARADKIDARNGRLKAGTARTLLLLERPGEALRLFDEAERLGYDPVHYAAERGLAFDLVGEQQRAQRDYRLALKQAPDDETLRRFALSLGISGRKDQALAQIDTLLRRSDRAAWRVRAFVLAMSGDVAGAEKIATSMLPPGMASGLMPFFAKLAALGPADRAFAVHFGEVAPTPARIADARLTPAYPPLPPEPQPVVRLAANPLSARDARADRRNRPQRERDRPVQVATAAVPPVLGALPPAPPRPTPRSAPAAPQQLKSQPAPAPQRAPAPPPVAQAVQAARSETMVVERPVAVVPAAAPTPASPEPAPAKSTPAQTVASITAPPPAPAAPDRAASASAVPAFTLAPPVRTAPSLAQVPPEPTPKAEQPPKADLTASAPAPVVARAEPAAPPPPAPPPPEPTAVATAAIAAPPVPAPDRSTAPPPVSEPEAAPARPVASEESILARIVASIAVPAAELGVPPVVAATRRPVPAANTPSAADSDLAKVKPTPPVLSPEEKRAAAKAEAKKLADQKLADKKLAEKQAADKKAAEEAAAAKKALKAEPSRVWVQVAGGANVADLPKEWTRLRGKAGALLQGRQSWTTPLRFTNRLLTGPFKSGDDAQAFVNQIAKSGITGFVFTSDAGQKIARLPAK